VTGEIHHVDAGFHVVGLAAVDRAVESSQLLGLFNHDSE